MYFNENFTIVATVIHVIFYLKYSSSILWTPTPLKLEKKNDKNRIFRFWLVGYGKGISIGIHFYVDENETMTTRNSQSLTFSEKVVTSFKRGIMRQI